VPGVTTLRLLLRMVEVSVKRVLVMCFICTSCLCRARTSVPRSRCRSVWASTTPWGLIGKFCLGWSEYGRPGLGEGVGASVTTAVQEVGAGSRGVTCGKAVSYALGEDGSCYSWGMGTNGQLGTGDEEDGWSPGMI
jgi:hypothetical protein